MNKLRKLFSHLTLRRKLLLILTSAVFFIVVLAVIAYVSTAQTISKKVIAPSALNSFADVLTQPDVIKLLHQNPEIQKDILGRMGNFFQISAAAIYDESGQLQSSFYSKNGLPTLPDKLTELKEQDLKHCQCTFRSMLVDNSLRGTLYIQADGDMAFRFASSTILASALIFMLGLFIIYAVLGLVEKLINRPVLKLMATARRITREENYSARAEKFNDDELGSLADSFNAMLAQIQMRDQQLRDEKDKAEKARQRAIELSESSRKTNDSLQKEVTIRAKIERKLTDYHSYLNNVISSMPSILIAVDNELRVTHANRASNIFCTTPDGTNSKPVEDAYALLAPYSTMMLTAIRDFRVQNIEKVTLPVKEQVRHFNIVIYPVEGLGSVGAVIRLDDITERLHLEDIMVQTEKMMSVGGLAAGMAHEINNPLGGIIHSLQNIQRRLSMDMGKNNDVAKSLGTDIPVIRSYLEQRGILQFLASIQDASERAATIVSNMLLFSRQSSKSKQPANLSELLERTITIANSDYNLSQGYDFKRIELIQNLDPDLHAVPCVSSELEQVFLNLLTNAAQALKTYAEEKPYDPDWHSIITIKTYKKGQQAIIEVSDNGPGMEENTRKRIFEPFFTTKDVGRGTGLGLSVSFFIISSHHQGTMTVESEPDKGTCFTISLPLNNDIQQLPIS